MNRKDSTTKISELITKKRRALYIKKGYISLLLRVILLLLAGYILLTQVFLITQARGNDMFPAIKDGDLVIGFRLQREYVKDDIVIYNHDNTSHLGRVVARPTDVVTMDDSGTLIINGGIQRGEIIYPTYAKEGQVYPLNLEENELFLLGDHRIEAKDSRDYGPIEEKHVKAKVITILRRRGL